MHRRTILTAVLAFMAAHAVLRSFQADQNLVDQLRQMLGSDKVPVDSLFSRLSLAHLNSFMCFSLARSMLNEPGGMDELVSARAKHVTNLGWGNEEIVKLRTRLKTQGSQDALKELALYWTTQMTLVSAIDRDDLEMVVLRRLRVMAERVRLESEW